MLRVFAVSLLKFSGRKLMSESEYKTQKGEGSVQIVDILEKGLKGNFAVREDVSREAMV